jgi:hypothetical protein
MLRLTCKPYHVNQLKMAKIMLIVINVGASRLMSSLALFNDFTCLVEII